MTLKLYPMKKYILLLLIFQSSLNPCFSQSITIDPTEQSELLIYQKNTGISTVVGRHKNFGLFQVEPSNSSNTLLRIGGQGFSGILGGYTSNVVQINFSPTQTFSSTNQGTKMTFHTTANNTTSTTERMRIDQNGNVGIGTNTPDTKLHIEGAENNGSDATLKIKSGNQNMIIDGNEIDSDVGMYLNHNSGQKVNIGVGGLFGSGATNFNLVPLGVVEYSATESLNGLSYSNTFTNLVGNLVINKGGHATIQADDTISMSLFFDQNIASQYSKIIAVGHPNYWGQSINPFSMASGAIGEIVGLIQENSIGELFYYTSVTVDDFPLTGSSTLFGTVMFYGIK
jgi:hypothetical protein